MFPKLRRSGSSVNGEPFPCCTVWPFAADLSSTPLFPLCVPTCVGLVHCQHHAVAAIEGNFHPSGLEGGGSRGASRTRARPGQRNPLSHKSASRVGNPCEHPWRATRERSWNPTQLCSDNVTESGVAVQASLVPVSRITCLPCSVFAFPATLSAHYLSRYRWLFWLY